MMIVKMIAVILMVSLVGDDGRPAKPLFFEVPEHACECEDPHGEGFWCDRCGGWLSEPDLAPAWLVWLGVGVGVIAIFLTFII